MNTKLLIGILLLGSIFISACNGGSSSQSYSPPTITRHGPFTTGCAHPLMTSASGPAGPSESSCSSISECSDSSVGLSGCQHFCINKNRYNSAVGARGYEENGRIMCECYCE